MKKQRVKVKDDLYYLMLTYSPGSAKRQANHVILFRPYRRLHALFRALPAATLFSAWDIELLMSQMQLMRLFGPYLRGMLSDCLQ